MNTTFKILWFEDEPAWFNMEKLRIEGILRTHYLIPVIERRDGDDFDLEELTGNDYDLIFMDYKLAEGTTGDTIVAAIRNSYILTDILFYSSEEQNMLSAIRKQMPPIDGVYLTKRDYTIFTEKAERIIQKIVKRSEDVVNLRGFVLDNTSAFEVRIREILNICWQKFKPEHKDVISKALEKQLENKSARVDKQIKAAKDAECTFTYANNNPYTLSVADRLDILQVVLLSFLSSVFPQFSRAFSSLFWVREILILLPVLFPFFSMPRSRPVSFRSQGIPRFLFRSLHIPVCRL